MATWFDKVAALVWSTLGARLDYLARYRAKLVAQSSDGKTVDVKPDDARLPGMSGIPLRVPAGMTIKVVPGAFVLVGWDSGDPSKPYATPEWDAGATVTEMDLEAVMVYVGSTTGAQPIPLGTSLLTWLNAHVHTSSAPGAPTSPVVTPATTVLLATKAKAA